MFAPSRGGLDLLELKHGTVLKTLIPKVAEGIFNVICQFNETDEYVLYYHGGHKTLRVFRVSDGDMIANYKVPSNLTSIESTSDGNSVALGMVDGNLVVLTIADPQRAKMRSYLKSLPSRDELQRCVTFKEGMVDGTKMNQLVGKTQKVNQYINKLRGTNEEKEPEDTSAKEEKE